MRPCSFRLCMFTKSHIALHSPAPVAMGWLRQALSPRCLNTALTLLQAAMLYVCLYFAPKMLKSKESQMREVVGGLLGYHWVNI